MHDWTPLGIEQKFDQRTELKWRFIGYKFRRKLFFPGATRGHTVDAMENISVTDPIGLAMERVKHILFRPFDLGKWFAIGFCAWLARLGEQGFSSGNGNFSGSNRHGGDAHQQLEHARSYVVENLYWILPLGIFLFALALALGVLFAWLNSRGKFMFLNCVAVNRADVAEPWKRFAKLANSLFWFRIGLAFVGLLITVPIIVFGFLVAMPMFRHDSWNVAGVMILIGLGFALLLIGICFGLIRKLTMDFVVPIMYLRGSRCLAAWREFRQMLSANFGDFVLYLLFQIVIGIVIAVIIVAVVLVTCCIAGCFMLIPYIGTVLLLPVHIFNRAYSLYYLAQYGPNYNVFQPVATASQ
jgi:hypothetical protein